MTRRSAGLTALLVVMCTGCGTASPGEASQASAAPAERSGASLDSAVVRLAIGEGTEDDLSAVDAAARAGDYQVRRNLAYALSQPGWWGHNAVLACAWRMVIVASGDQRVSELDADQAINDCGKLTPTARVAAEAQAKALVQPPAAEPDERPDPRASQGQQIHL